jgi:hypothetical protein
MLTRAVRVAFAAIAMSVATGLGAQVRPAARASTLVPSVAIASNAPAPVRAAAVVVSNATARSFQVVSVPVPADFNAAWEVRYAIIDINGVRVLGAKEGVIAPATGNATRRATLLIGLQPTLTAGTHEVVMVRFVADDRLVMDVPVDVVVSRYDRVRLLTTTAPLIAEPGETVHLPTRVMNDGNSAVRTGLVVMAPPSWAPGVPRGDVTIAPFRAYDAPVTLRIPANAENGSYTVKIRVQRDGEADEERLVRVGIVRPAEVSSSELHATLALTAGTSDRGATQATELAVSGSVAPGVVVAARGAFSSRHEGLLEAGLARAGAVVGIPNVAVTGAGWRMDVGQALSGFGPLAGVSASGRGAQFTATRGRFGLNAIAIVPEAMAGRSLGVQGYVLSGRDTTRIAVSSFDERATNATRQLQAASLATQRTLPVLGQLSGGVAWRMWNGGSGLGWQAGLSQSGRLGRLEARFTDAPGGASAFASGRRQLLLSSEVTPLSWWKVGASVDRVQDTTAYAQWYESQVTSLRSGVRIAGGFDLRAEARDTRITTARAVDDTAGFDGNQREAIGSIGWTVGTLRLSTDVSSGVVARRAGLGETVAPHSAVRVDASYAGRFGSIAAGVGYERNALVGDGSAGRTMRVRVDGARVGIAGHDVQLSAESEQVPVFGRGAEQSLRIAARTRLAGETYLLVSAERLPFSVDPGRSPWVFITRFERGMRIATPASFVRHGVVFRDDDGNGLRGPDEPVVPGLIIGVGDERVRSDEAGRFVLPPGGAPVLMASSLDIGLLAGTWNASRRTIAVVPTSDVDVTLVSGDTRVTQDLLAFARVVARNGAGHEYVARPLATGAARFDALPAGDYTLMVEGDRSPEPLRIADGSDPGLQVRSGHLTQVTLRVAGRPMRLRDGSNGILGAPKGGTGQGGTQGGTTPGRGAQSRGAGAR